MRIAKPFFTLLLLVQPRSPLGRGGLLGFPRQFGRSAANEPPGIRTRRAGNPYFTRTDFTVLFEARYLVDPIVPPEYVATNRHLPRYFGLYR
jgi:hypothetical protein